jgi:hypothetical protein
MGGYRYNEIAGVKAVHLCSSIAISQRFGRPNIFNSQRLLRL